MSDQLMEVLLRVLEVQSATVLEEALLAVGSLAEVIGKPFTKYLKQLYPRIKTGLENFRQYQVNTSAKSMVFIFSFADSVAICHGF